MQRSELFCRVMLPNPECDEVTDAEEAKSCRLCSCITAGMSNGLQCSLDEETGRCYYPGEGFRFPDSYKENCSMKNKEEYHCFVREGLLSKLVNRRKCHSEIRCNNTIRVSCRYGK